MVYSVPRHEVAKEHFNYPIHHAEHARLNKGQRLAVQHYGESVYRLVRKRDAYRRLIESMPISPLGTHRIVTADGQHEVFDATQSYFDQLYTTLSALASVQHRCGHVWAPRVPPTRSVEKYIGWWADHSEFMFQDEVIPALEAARDYRTLTVHSQQKPVFDWRTLGYGPPTHAIGIVLFGQVSSSGNPPDGAFLLEEVDTQWEMPAPNMDDSLWAMLILSGMVFHILAGTIPIDDGIDCSWSDMERERARAEGFEHG